MQDVCDVPRDRLVGSNGKDAVLDGDRRHLKMLPFAKLAQSAGGIICCFARIPRGDVLFDSIP
jgi:hypothetical protein